MWGFFQIGLLSIGASRFGIWVHDPSPREALTLPILWSGQVIFLALFFPKLTAGYSLSVAVLALTIPFDELAGVLSNSTQNFIFSGFIFVALWMLGLGTGNRLAKNRPKYQLTLSLLASLYSVGELILNYLRQEAMSSVKISSIDSGGLILRLCHLGDANGIAAFEIAAVPLLLLGVFAIVLHLRHWAKNWSSTSLHRPA